MAPPLNVLGRGLETVGSGMNQYFRWNFGTNYMGVPTAAAAQRAGFSPNKAFATSLLGTSLLTRAVSDSLPRQEKKKPLFGDGDEATLADTAYDYTVGIFNPRQGKLADTFEQNLSLSQQKGIQPLSEQAFNAAKQREYGGGGIFRINRQGEGSELVGRDTATLFNQTVANPLWRFDSQLGKENVDRLTQGAGLTSLATSAYALKPFEALSGGKTVNYGLKDTLKVATGSIAKGLGSAALVYNAVTDFADSKNAGDSDLRAVTNSASNVGGSLGGAWLGGKTAAALASPLLLTPAAPAVPFIALGGTILGGIAGSGLGGWTSDRVLDLFGEGKEAKNALANANAKYENALIAKEQRSNETMSETSRSTEAKSDKGGFTNYSANPFDHLVKDVKDLARNPKYLTEMDANQRKQQSEFRKQDINQQTDYRKQNLDAEGSLYNYGLQDASRRYNTDRTTDVTLKLGTQKNQNDYAVGTQKNEVDYAVGMHGNEVKRDVGRYTSDNQLKASNFKSLSELQSNLDKNEKQSGDNRNETAVKYQTQKDINKYQWDNVNQTSLAESQVKAGTYGMSKDAQSKAANDKTNFDSWKRQNDANHDYTDRQNAQMKLGVDMAQTQRAYNDQQRDKDNDRMAASARWQHETAVKAADRSQFYAEQKAQRDQQRADFGLRSQQIQAQISAADRDYGLRASEYGLKASESAARVNQINTDVSLKSQQFAAARGDVTYNRDSQRRSRAF